MLDTPEPDLSYLFKHVIVQEAAYNLMLLSQRRQLHRSVAEWYEQAGGGDLALLAHHGGWPRSGQGGRLPGAGRHRGPAGGRLRRGRPVLHRPAGGRRRRRGRPGWCGGGRGTPEDAAIRRARWEHQLGDAYLGLGQLAPEQEHLHAALALLGRRAPASGRRLPGKLAWQAGQQLRNRVWPRPLVARSAEARAALEEAAEVYDRLFLVDYHASKLVQAVHQAVKGLNLAEAAGSPSGEARLAAACAVGAGLLGRHRVAQGYLSHAAVALEGAGDPSATASVLQSAALYKLGVGRWAEVREHRTMRPRSCAGSATRAGWPRSPASGSGSGTSRATCRPWSRCWPSWTGWAAIAATPRCGPGRWPATPWPGCAPASWRRP